MRNPFQKAGLCRASLQHPDDDFIRRFPKTRRIMVLILSLCAGFPALSQSIAVAGQWALTINSTNLQAGAGSDLIDTYESATDQVLADVKPGPFGKTWVVQVHKTDHLWNSNLYLDIRRQTYPKIQGGLSYIELTDSDQDFFWSENRKRSLDIPIQFRLRGVSISIPVNTYSTTIYYTLIDS